MGCAKLARIITTYDDLYGNYGENCQRVFRGKMDKCAEFDRVIPSVIRLKSGPLGGDQQMGAMISEGKIDMMIFLWDPMQAQPHDVDVKALLRIASLYNIPIATNKATADFLISSPLFHQDYQPERKDYTSYLTRDLEVD